MPAWFLQFESLHCEPTVRAPRIGEIKQFVFDKRELSRVVLRQNARYRFDRTEIFFARPTWRFCRIKIKFPLNAIAYHHQRRELSSVTIGQLVRSMVALLHKSLSISCIENFLAGKFAKTFWCVFVCGQGHSDGDVNATEIENGKWLTYCLFAPSKRKLSFNISFNWNQNCWDILQK